MAKSIGALWVGSGRGRARQKGCLLTCHNLGAGDAHAWSSRSATSRPRCLRLSPGPRPPVSLPRPAEVLRSFPALQSCKRGVGDTRAVDRRHGCGEWIQALEASQISVAIVADFVGAVSCPYNERIRSLPTSGCMHACAYACMSLSVTRWSGRGCGRRQPNQRVPFRLGAVK
jgi:hypothetical protein